MHITFTSSSKSVGVWVVPSYPMEYLLQEDSLWRQWERGEGSDGRLQSRKEYTHLPAPLVNSTNAIYYWIALIMLNL